MKINNPYLPVLELTRGDDYQNIQNQIVESIHYGAIAIVDVHGKLVASYGDALTSTYLRSSAKPFQALPLLETGGQQKYQITPQELALICSSHSGTDQHLEVVLGLQKKTGVKETDLLCGTHQPMHEPTAEALRQRGETPNPNRHNCSGKHTGMLTLANMTGQPKADYINPQHAIQRSILSTFADMCKLNTDSVTVGTDGCSAPNFAVPLDNAALAYARLCDPQAGEVLPPGRAAACQAIVSAMTAHPDMVGGPARFDTSLMKVSGGRLLSKGGAEGYQAIGILPGALGIGSPALGIALKISDGDLKWRAAPAVTIEVLHQLKVLTVSELEKIAPFGPVIQIYNFRKLHVGEARPCFQLEWT